MMATFSVYLLQLMTNNDSLIDQKFPILKFIHQKFPILKLHHKYQETSYLAFTCSKSTMETPEQCVFFSI